MLSWDDLGSYECFHGTVLGAVNAFMGQSEELRMLSWDSLWSYECFHGTVLDAGQ